MACDAPVIAAYPDDAAAQMGGTLAPLPAISPSCRSGARCWSASVS